MVSIRTPTVALVGNPNTGKTTLFNALAGMRQRVGNYPGVTVETKKGKLYHGDLVFEIIDLPGTYSLAPRSPDEMLAVDLLLGQQRGEPRPDVILAIVDASNLERNLYLVTQVMELGAPVVVALNMTDIAQAHGIRIDADKLGRQLGVPIVPIQANKGRGLAELKNAVAAALDQTCPSVGPVFPEPFAKAEQTLRSALGAGVSDYLVRRLLLDVGGYTEELLSRRHGNGFQNAVKEARRSLVEAGCPVPAVEARARYAWIRQAAAPAVTRPAHRPITWTDRLDRVLTHKVWGTLIFLGLMFVVFQSIFAWAKPLMDWIDQGRGALGKLIEDTLSPGPLRSLLADGVVKGVGAVLVFLPQILILFAFIAILEDCGYMARAAFLMDKIMARCGLNGRSFIPLLSSVACAVPGIMAARVIENRRDRLATILVAPLMSCSARLPVYMLLIGAFLGPAHGFAWYVPGLALFAMYAIGLVVAPLVALVLKRTLLRGETPVFVMEMPLYKAPSARLVLRRAVDASWMFIRRAGTLILASMILVWSLLYFPSADGDGNAYEQTIASLEEKLDKARDSGDAGAAEAIEGQLNRVQREWKGQSVLGRLGRAIEPAVAPLGWDWRIGMAALASFPAREVFVGSMGLIFGEGEVETDDIRKAGLGGQTGLGDRLRQEAIFTVPTALSVMVFFALCCQCASTLAVIKRETNSWTWPVFTFAYMTVLAYVGALIVYQVGTLLVQGNDMDGQLTSVILLVAAAVCYLFWSGWRTWKGRKTGCKPDCGCGPAKAKPSENGLIAPESLQLRPRER